MGKGIRHKTVGIELSQAEFEADDSHQLDEGTSFPGSPSEGDLFYRTDEHIWYIYDGTGWKQLNLALTNPISGMASGLREEHGETYVSIGTSTCTSASISFGEAFSSTPVVIVSLRIGGTSNPQYRAAFYTNGQGAIQLWSRNTSGFSVYLCSCQFGGYNTAYIDWWAVGT